MRARSLTGLALALLFVFAGVRTYPPSDGGAAGSSGPGLSSLLVGLQAYYSFDATGTSSPAITTADMGWDSSQMHHLSSSGSLPGSTTTAKSGRAIQPDTSTGQGLFSADVTFRQTGDFSVSMWSRHNAVGGCTSSGWAEQTPLFSMGSTNKADTTADYRAFTYVTGDPPSEYRFQVCDSVAGCSNVTVTATSTYANYVMIYTASAKTFQLYTNGALTATSAALTNGLSQTGVRFWVMPEQTSQCQPRVDELAVWNVALNATKIACLYNGGAGSFYPFAGICTS